MIDTSCLVQETTGSSRKFVRQDLMMFSYCADKQVSVLLHTTLACLLPCVIKWHLTGSTAYAALGIEESDAWCAMSATSCFHCVLFVVVLHAECCVVCHNF